MSSTSSPNASACSSAPRARVTTSWPPCSAPRPMTTSCACSPAPTRSRPSWKARTGRTCSPPTAAPPTSCASRTGRTGRTPASPTRRCSAPPEELALADALDRAAPAARERLAAEDFARRHGRARRAPRAARRVLRSRHGERCGPGTQAQPLALAGQTPRRHGCRRGPFQDRRLGDSPMAKWVYGFGAGRNEGSAEMRNLLGGKGANLAEMASIGLPVPPGFTITTEVCTCVLRARQAVPRGAARAGRGGARPDRGGGRQPLRRPAQAAARLGALRRARLHAGHDGHRAEPRPQRRRRSRGSRRPPATRASPGTATAASSRCTAPSCSASTTTASRRSSRTPSSTRRDGGHRAHRAATGAAWWTATRRWCEEVRGEPFPQDPEDAALGRHRRRVRLLDEPARQHLPPPARHPGRLGHGGERAGHGVRQHGRGLRHRRLLHPRPVHGRERLLRRVPDQRPGRGRRGRHPHAAADERSARQAGRAQHGSAPCPQPTPSW